MNLLESRFELLGHVAIVFGFPHDLADQPLLAVQVIVVEFLIEVLEHGDPLDDVQTVVVISVIGRSNDTQIEKLIQFHLFFCLS